jgi:hypothetical protein
VIETNTLGYWAESDRLHALPALGQLVVVNGPEELNTYGVVTFGQTGGIDPSRRAVRRGGGEAEDEAIYRRHPELEHILRTTFRVAVVGFERAGRLRHTLPPLPAPLHYSVNTCAPDGVRRFCAQPRYFADLLAYKGELDPAQVIATHLRWVDELLDDQHVWLTDATRQVARLMKRDYDRLVVLLETVDPDTN